MQYYKISTIILAILLILAVYYNAFIRYESYDTIESVANNCIITLNQSINNMIDNCFDYTCGLINCTWTDEEIEVIDEVCGEILLGENS